MVWDWPPCPPLSRFPDGDFQRRHLADAEMILQQQQDFTASVGQSESKGGFHRRTIAGVLREASGNIDCDGFAYCTEIPT
jgi:hypothetical protein